MGFQYHHPLFSTLNLLQCFGLFRVAWLFSKNPFITSYWLNFFQLYMNFSWGIASRTFWVIEVLNLCIYSRSYNFYLISLGVLCSISLTKYVFCSFPTINGLNMELFWALFFVSVFNDSLPLSSLWSSLCIFLTPSSCSLILDFRSFNCSSCLKRYV